MIVHYSDEQLRMLQEMGLNREEACMDYLEEDDGNEGGPISRLSAHYLHFHVQSSKCSRHFHRKDPPVWFHYRAYILRLMNFYLFVMCRDAQLIDLLRHGVRYIVGSCSPTGHLWHHQETAECHPCHGGHVHLGR